ncbi:MAG: YdcF family protein [Deltaproteobacteria bacterium]|nr:YdcF family protein [Deltaproteobacteria bacterium]
MSSIFFKDLLLFFGFPFSLSLLLIGSGLVLFWGRRRMKLASLLVISGAGLLLLFSLPLVSMSLVGSLEKRFADLPGDDLGNPEWASVKYVVVLAGGSSPDGTLPITSRQHYAQLARVIEGMRIYLKRPGTKIVVSGAAFNGRPDSEVMSQFLKEMGVKGGDIIEESRSLNTFQQALYLKKIVGEEKFFLVTSAVHMPRSAALFQKAGLHPIPHPADHRYRKPGWLVGIRPRVESLWISETALYEYYGLLQSRLLGRI